MKKILLFLTLVIVAFAINSCSSDGKSDKATGTISFKANGVQKTFHSIHWHSVTNLAGTPDQYTTISIRTDGNEFYDSIYFSLIKGSMAGNPNTFGYYDNGDDLYTLDNFPVNITTNDDGKLIGTFSGDMFGSAGTVTITEGTFNIQY
jgi:hypothetical protein